MIKDITEIIFLIITTTIWKMELGGLWQEWFRGRGAVTVVQTERSQRISSGIDEKLQSFWLYCEDRDPTRKTGCGIYRRNDSSTGFGQIS